MGSYFIDKGFRKRNVFRPSVVIKGSTQGHAFVECGKCGGERSAECLIGTLVGTFARIIAVAHGIAVERVVGDKLVEPHGQLPCFGKRNAVEQI